MRDRFRWTIRSRQCVELVVGGPASGLQNMKGFASSVGSQHFTILSESIPLVALRVFQGLVQEFASHLDRVIACN